jgi:hypothetical protein
LLTRHTHCVHFGVRLTRFLMVSLPHNDIILRYHAADIRIWSSGEAAFLGKVNR